MGQPCLSHSWWKSAVWGQLEGPVWYFSLSSPVGERPLWAAEDTQFALAARCLEEGRGNLVSLL